MKINDSQMEINHFVVKIEVISEEDILKGATCCIMKSYTISSH